MAKSTDVILRVLSSGSNVIVPGSKPTEHLCELARTARQHGAHLTIRNCRKPESSLLEIAKAGGSHVTFDFSD